MKKILTLMAMNTVRKKVMLLSKLVGISIALLYLFTSQLTSHQDFAFLFWLGLVIAIILFVDIMLGRFISRPLGEINGAARQMAKLDFSAHCDISTDDEFGELSTNLNTMFSKLKDSIEKLEDANKQLEKDVAREHFLLTQRKELVDSLSHEMKTPLSVIRAYVEGLKDETNDPTKQKYIDTIQSATEHMNSVITSFLDLSALEAGATQLSDERFDFVELVETVAGRLLIDTPNPHFNFTYELPEHEIFIYADKARIEQVLNNLILNARKYVVTRGKIHISVISQDRNLQFSIYNQGKQIPSSDSHRVWDKFYRGEEVSESSIKGSGLGLAIVAQILKAYNSNYSITNLNDGVVFVFHFPID